MALSVEGIVSQGLSVRVCRRNEVPRELIFLCGETVLIKSDFTDRKSVV